MDLTAFFDEPLEKPKLLSPVETAEKAIREKSGLLVSSFLVCGYSYEVLDIPLIPDHLFDSLCVALDEAWGSVDHMHKHLVDRGALRSSTASYLTEDYTPEIVKSVARRHAFSGWD